MTRYGCELEFISWIHKNGSGTTPASEIKSMIDACQHEEFSLVRLSISEDTYVASNFNLYVVKLKNSPTTIFAQSEDE